MKTIQANAHIVTSNGANAKGVSCNLEAYFLSSRTWKAIASAKTNASGKWIVKVARVLANTSYAPSLRLTETGNPVPRVLAHGGYLSYHPSKFILTIDFGIIQRLDESAYALPASSSAFARSKYTVAGIPKKPLILMTALNANTTFTANTPQATLAVDANTATVKPSIVLDNFNAEVLKFKASEVNLQSKISQKNEALAAKTKELNATKLQIDGLEKKLAKSEAAEKELILKNKTFTDEAERKTPIQNIAANIGNEMNEANNKLSKEKRPYRFGRIELDLRGTVSTDGQSMSLASMVDLKDVGGSAALPGMKVEILPNNVSTQELDDVTVPDVIGLTETAVRRLLQAVGLQLEMVSKSVETSENIPFGQSMQQSPKAGGKIARGENILVVFAS